MDQTKKYVGLVRWFNNSENVNYGIIYHSTIGDLLFTEQIFKDQGLSCFAEAKEITIPRLLEAAKEFNIGKDTLLDFLSLCFNIGGLKPTSKFCPRRSSPD